MTNHSPFQISFRATLFTLMIAVLLTAVALVGGAGYFYAKFAVENLGQQVLEQAAERIDQHVQHALDVAEHEATTVQTLLSDQQFDADDHEGVTDYFLASLQARPSLSYLSFGTPTGKYYHAFRDRDGNLSVLWLVPQANGDRRLTEFSISSTGKRQTVRDIAQSVRTPPYERPYYIAARDEGEPLWTESYVFLGSGESLDVPGVSRAIPVFDRADKQLSGVLTADFDLFALSGFLGEVDLGPEGLCFLVEIDSDGQPRVIAHPDAASSDAAKRLDLTQPAPDGNGRITIAADRVPDARVTNALHAMDNGLNSVQESLHEISVKVLDTRYVGGFRHLDREDGPDWVICMLIPEAELLGDVQRMARLMVILGVCGLVVAGMLSLLLSRRISRSLGTIADETREIGRFELSAKAPIPSRIREIQTLAGSVEEMKTSLRSFQKYVPSELVRQLIKSGQEAELGGTRKELTVYFSDIVGFTSISEKLPADQLVSILSEYLGEMSSEILQNRGTVDKYIGDAVMAFWGAPLPHEMHAADACRTALANQARLKSLRSAWEAAGLPPLHARIGLHTGHATVGNFGSPNRLDYTAIGDTVNVASRLERLNSIYGTRILISETTESIVSGHFITRPLDKVAVKGRKQGMRVFELIDARLSPDQADPDWVRRYREGLENYLERRWQQAIECFEGVIRERSADKPSEVMIRRCHTYETTPPADEWNGVFRAPK